MVPHPAKQPFAQEEQLEPPVPPEPLEPPVLPPVVEPEQLPEQLPEQSPEQSPEHEPEQLFLHEPLHPNMGSSSPPQAMKLGVNAIIPIIGTIALIPFLKKERRSMWLFICNC